MSSPRRWMRAGRAALAGAGWRTVGAALGGGAAVALSFPPRRWWAFGVAGMAVLVVLIRDRRPRERFVLGGAFAFAMVITAFVTIWTGGVPWLVVLAELLAAALLALFFGLVLLAVPSGRGLWLGFPSALVLLAALQARWPFGGLPGVGIPFGQAGGPLDDVARLAGERTIVAVVTVAAVGLGALWRPVRLRVVLAAAALVALLLVGGYTVPAGRGVGRIEVAAVQGGGQRGVQATAYDENFRLQHTAARGVERPVDLVVLPEGTAHVRRDVAETYEARALARTARRLDAHVVAGVVERVDDAHFRNGVVMWGPDGELVARYDKRHPVPFAERVPARSILAKVVPVADLVPRDMVNGAEPGVFRSGAGTWGVVVSFEVFFDRLVRDVVRGGAELVLVPTNASSFRDSTVPDFEVAAAQLRAVESGRWVVQSAPTGYTALVAPSGRVVARSALGSDPAVVSAPVELRRGLTPYARVGEWPLVLLAALGFAGAWFLDRPSGLARLLDRSRPRPSRLSRRRP